MKNIVDSTVLHGTMQSLQCSRVARLKVLKKHVISITENAGKYTTIIISKKTNLYEVKDINVNITTIIDFSFLFSSSTPRALRLLVKNAIKNTQGMSSEQVVQIFLF